MVDILGRKILPNILQGLNHQKSKLHWPKEEVPLQYWNNWSAYLTIFIKEQVQQYSVSEVCNDTHQIFPWKLCNNEKILIEGETKYL